VVGKRPAMVDRIWYDWQRRHPSNGNSFFGGSVLTLEWAESLEAFEQYPNGAPPYLSLNSNMPVDGLFPDVTIGDVIDTTSGALCYTYEQIDTNHDTRDHVRLVLDYLASHETSFDSFPSSLSLFDDDTSR